jgi:hypothetical protein
MSGSGIAAAAISFIAPTFAVEAMRSVFAPAMDAWWTIAGCEGEEEAEADGQGVDFRGHASSTTIQPEPHC